MFVLSAEAPNEKVSGGQFSIAHTLDYVDAVPTSSAKQFRAAISPSRLNAWVFFYVELNNVHFDLKILCCY